MLYPQSIAIPYGKGDVHAGPSSGTSISSVVSALACNTCATLPGLKTMGLLGPSLDLCGLKLYSIEEGKGGVGWKKRKRVLEELVESEGKGGAP